MNQQCVAEAKSLFTVANAVIMEIGQNHLLMDVQLGKYQFDYIIFRCVIINEANRKNLRVGDTIIIEKYDPLGEDVQFLEDYS